MDKILKPSRIARVVRVVTDSNRLRMASMVSNKTVSSRLRTASSRMANNSKLEMVSSRLRTANNRLRMASK